MEEKHFCVWCGEPLEFKQGKGWIHENGGLYVQRCESCQRKLSLREATFVCPFCGGKLVDDHCALPNFGRKR